MVVCGTFSWGLVLVDIKVVVMVVICQGTSASAGGCVMVVGE